MRKLFDFNTSQHKALITFLKKIDIFHYVKYNPTEKFYCDEVKMDSDDINRGVKLLCVFWNIHSGSTGEIDLYQLLQKYLLDVDARDRINKAMYSSKEQAE